MRNSTHTHIHVYTYTWTHTSTYAYTHTCTLLKLVHSCWGRGTKIWRDSHVTSLVNGSVLCDLGVCAPCCHPFILYPLCWNQVCHLHNPASPDSPGKEGTFLSQLVPCPPWARPALQRPSLGPHELPLSCLSSGPAVICSACSANFPVSRHGIWYSSAWINVRPLSSSAESYFSPKFRPARLNNFTKMLGWKLLQAIPAESQHLTPRLKLWSLS